MIRTGELVVQEQIVSAEEKKQRQMSISRSKTTKRKRVAGRGKELGKAL